MSLSLPILNVTIALIMLLYTSYLDLKKREVEDKVWLAFGVLGVSSLVYQALTGMVANWVLVGFSIGLTTAIGLGLFFFGFYGGADGKALIVLSLFVPIFKPAVGLYDFAPLIVLTNGVLVSMVLPLALLCLNSVRLLRKNPIFKGFEGEPLYRKLLASLLGYKQLGRPRPFQFSLERSDGQDEAKNQTEEITTGSNQQKKFDFSLMRDDFEEKPGRWVTPGIPLLVFFTAGYVALLLYGDLVIGLIAFFFHLK